MTYEQFKELWTRALQGAGFSVMGVELVEESLDLRSMRRKCRSVVGVAGWWEQPLVHTTASFEYAWDALQSARTATTEEDLLSELLDRDAVDEVQTERPWLRVDVTLHASGTYGKARSMPSPAAWAKWAAEALDRLERSEPLVSEAVTREGRGGRIVHLAWQGEPQARVLVARDGSLRLEGIELRSWQGIELPRRWDDPARRPDAPPDQQLVAMFGRVKAALAAWRESMDRLRPA
ncbi:MAG TPA: hypothetical protein VNO30_14760 [Kofleriaceae bacterium]|nr:hypothetical protein [Kofleriaceae bacterium]